MNYKKLGDYIVQVNKRNKGIISDDLRGLSMTKEFRKSTSNIIGTDLSKYKLVGKEQFACDFMSVIRVHKLPVVLHTAEQPVIVSPAYTVFEVVDKNKLLPEYLMMWFRRSEFDRYADFRCDSAIRGGFKWDELCEVTLPIPSIEEQHDIVKEYNTVVDRIQLSEAINKNLEETAQTIYKHWFVDFEFPNEEGKPYKSSGGKMVYNLELSKEIPKEWEVKKLGELLKSKGYIRGPFGSALKKADMCEYGIPVYEQQHAIYNHRNFRYYIDKDKYEKLKRFSVEPNDLIISCSGTLGKISIIGRGDQKGIINQALLILRVNTNIIAPSLMYCYLTSEEGNKKLVETSIGSAQVNIAKREIIQSIPFLYSNVELLDKFTEKLKILYKNIEVCRLLNIELIKLKDILLSKMSKRTPKKTLV